MVNSTDARQSADNELVDLRLYSEKILRPCDSSSEISLKSKFLAAALPRRQGFWRKYSVTSRWEKYLKNNLFRAYF